MYAVKLISSSVAEISCRSNSWLMHPLIVAPANSRARGNMIRTVGTLYVVTYNVPDNPWETVSLPSFRSLQIKAICLKVECSSSAFNLSLYKNRLFFSFLRQYSTRFVLSFGMFIKIRRTIAYLSIKIKPVINILEALN